MRFFRYLFDRVIEEAEKVDTKSGEREVHNELVLTSSDDYETQRLFEHYLKKLERRVILLFDDFDIVVNELNKDDVVKIMHKIRVLTQAMDLLDKLNCIFVSTDSLEQLFKTKGFTIDSPLSRIMLDYEFLRPMDDKEIEQLITRPLQQLERKDIRFTREEINAVMFYVHGVDRNPLKFLLIESNCDFGPYVGAAVLYFFACACNADRDHQGIVSVKDVCGIANFAYDIKNGLAIVNFN